MAIPAEFKSEYENEEQFTDRFLVPLLRRMGFSVVVHYHGKREFGKDLIFAEVNQFGLVTYHGLQAKYVDKVSQSDSHGLVEDAKEAFYNAFEHPNTGAKEYINTFYVANGGSIPDNARTNFFNALQVPHGGRVRLLDAKALIALDRTAAMRQIERVSETLFGVQLECVYNIMCIDRMLTRLVAFQNDTMTPLPNDRYRTLALGHYLVRPITCEELQVDTIHNVWHRCERTNRLLDTINSPTTPENRANIVESLIESLPKIKPELQAILVAINEVVKNLRPLAKL